MASSPAPRTDTKDLQLRLETEFHFDCMVDYGPIFLVPMGYALRDVFWPRSTEENQRLLILLNEIEVTNRDLVRFAPTRKQRGIARRMANRASGCIAKVKKRLSPNGN